MSNHQWDLKWSPILDTNFDFSKYKANVEPWLETQDGWFKIGSPEYKEYMEKMENKPQLLNEYDSADDRPLTDAEIALLNIEEANRKWVEEQKQKYPEVIDEGGRENFA